MQALPVFDIKIAFTFTCTFYITAAIFLEIFLICIRKNMNISKTKKKDMNQKGKCHSSSPWRAFQISSNFFYFIHTLNIMWIRGGGGGVGYV